MTTPSGDEPDSRDSTDGEPQAPAEVPAEVPFDPYRFGKPDRPVPPEYAPPGYVPDPVPPQQPEPQPYSYPYQQQGPYAPYGQTGPYGQPPMPPQHDVYGRPRTGNGKAVASLVLGIASVLLFWLSVLNAIPIVISVVLGIVALTESRRRNGAGRGMAIAGLVLSTIGTIATVIVTIWFVHVASQCGGFDSTGDPGFQQCLQDHV